jgi:hypothetical protein
MFRCGPLRFAHLVEAGVHILKAIGVEDESDDIEGYERPYPFANFHVDGWENKVAFGPLTYLEIDSRKAQTGCSPKAALAWSIMTAMTS